RSVENRNTPWAPLFVSWISESSTPAFTTALSTAIRVVNGTNTNGTPHETTCTGQPVPATAAGDSDSAAAARAGSGIGSPKVGSACVIQTNVKWPPCHVSVTGV